MFTNAEDTYTRLLVLRLGQRSGGRRFNLVACALELALPARVQKTYWSASEGHTEEQQEFPNNGGILMDSRSKTNGWFLVGKTPCMSISGLLRLRISDLLAALSSEMPAEALAVLELRAGSHRCGARA